MTLLRQQTLYELLSICFKVSPGAQPFIWKCVRFARKNAQQQLIFMWKAALQDWLWIRGKKHLQMAYRVLLFTVITATLQQLVLPIALGCKTRKRFLQCFSHWRRNKIARQVSNALKIDMLRKLFNLLTKNQIRIPDKMAAIKQRTNSCHIFSNAFKTSPAILLDSSFVANTGLCNILNVIFGVPEIKGKITFTAGVLHLLLAKWLCRQCFVTFRTSLSKPGLFGKNCT